MFFLDTETSGFSKNHLIELAYIKDNWERFEKRYWLKEGESIELEAMSIHHITEKMIEGKSIFEEDESYESLAQIMQNEVMVCHNMNYDYNEVLSGVYNMKCPGRICTLKIAKRLLPDLPKYNLQYLRYYFGLEFNEVIDPHAAISDVIVLEAVYNELFKIAKERQPQMSDEEIIDAFVKLESMPVLLKTISFWKHKWTEFKEVPRDYLEWLLGSSEDEDVIFTIKKILKK